MTGCVTNHATEESSGRVSYWTVLKLSSNDSEDTKEAGGRQSKNWGIYERDIL